MVTSSWINTDEAADVAGSIRHALRTVACVAEDPQAWKWVSLALHSALQGACVCHLSTTAAPLGVVTKKNAKDWLDYFERNRTEKNTRPPRTYLMPLPDLLKHVRLPHSAGDRSNESGISISDSELAWLCRFHDEIRNQFVHFAPRGWAIEISGIPHITLLIARIIADISEVGWAFRHMSATSFDDLRSDLRRLATVTFPI